MVVLPTIGFGLSSSASEEILTQKIVILKARGLVVEKIDNQTLRMPANMTLFLEPVMKYRGAIGFKVVNGTVIVNGTTYVIAEGKGLVIGRRHGIILQANGTGPDEQTVSLRIAGRYFWMWGHLYMARLRGVLRVDDAMLWLWLRAAVRAP